MFIECSRQPFQVNDRPIGLQFYHVKDELVRPAEFLHFNLGGILACHRPEDFVRHGEDRERFPVDNHVLELDADPIEKAKK
jgi:hypothetical protein